MTHHNKKAAGTPAAFLLFKGIFHQLAVFDAGSGVLLVGHVVKIGKRAMQSARTSLNFGDIRNVAKFKVDPDKNTTGIPQGPVTNFYQTINSAKELSPYEMEIRTQAMLKRSVWA